MKTQVILKRVYEPPDCKDGLRILVDRLWPRGLTKEKAKVDVWMKTIAPSNELRRWVHQDAQNWPEFEVRYYAELDANPGAVNELVEYMKQGDAVLLYAAKSQTQNHVLVLKAYLESVLSRQ